MKKFLFILLITALLLSSCSSGGNQYASNTSASKEVSFTGSAPAENGLYDSYYSEAEAESQKLSETTLPSDRKIIRNASLDIEAKDASALYKSIVAYCTDLGGYEFGSETSNYESYSVIHATLKIPPEKLDALISFAGENGKIVNSRINSEDITDSYFDAQTRLETKRKTLEKYYSLLEDSRSIEDLVYIQRIIDEITEDIEAFEGRLKLWNSLVDMATLTLYIRQENDPVTIKKEITWNALTFEDMGYLIRNGFISVSNAFVTCLQWVLILLTVLSPLWITALIIIFIIFKLRKRGKAGKAAAAPMNSVAHNGDVENKRE